MRILMTGGAGFIGAWVAKRLNARGIEIRSFDLGGPSAAVREVLGAVADHIDWRTGDVADAEAVAYAARDTHAVIHLAALLTPACQEDPLRGARVNLMGTLNVFEAALKQGHDRVLYMSSAGVFGPDDGTTPRPTTHYGAFKLAAEGCARAYHVDRGISSLGLRPLVVYGPGREVGLTAGPSLACMAAVRHEPYTIPFSGETDFVFVDDVAAVFDAALQEPLEGASVHNLTGEVASVERVATLIRAQVPDAVLSIDGPRVPVAPYLDTGCLRALFPEVPHTALADGLAQTIAYYAR